MSKLEIINNIQGGKLSLYAGKVIKCNEVSINDTKAVNITLCANAWDPIEKKEEERTCEIAFWNNNNGEKRNQLADRIISAKVGVNSFISALITVNNKFKIFSIDNDEYVQQSKCDVFYTDGNCNNKERSIVLYDTLPCGTYELYHCVSPTEITSIGMFVIEETGEFPLVKKNTQTNEYEISVITDDKWRDKKPVIVGTGINFKYSGLWAFPGTDEHNEVNVLIGRVNRLKEYDKHVSVDMVELRNTGNIWRHISFWNNGNNKLADWAKKVLVPRDNEQKPTAIIVCGKDKPFTYTKGSEQITESCYNAFRFDLIKAE